MATPAFRSQSENAGLSDLRVIADEIQDGAPGYYSTPYFVRRDSAINRIEDMKGKVAVTNGLGSGVDIIMRTALRRHGLEVQRDYTMIEAPFPTHKEMLKEHKGDLVVGVLPFSYDRELNEFAKPLFTTQSSLGRIALSFWVVRQSFIQKNRAALIDLLEDYGTMLRWFYDGANHDEAVGITRGSRTAGRLPCRTGCSRPGNFYRDLDGKPDLNVIQESIDKVQEVGLIRRRRSRFRGYADLSLLEDAARRRR